MRDYIFIDQDLDVLKSCLNSSKKPVYHRLINHCDSYFGRTLPEGHPPSSTTFMGIAMVNLSLAFLLSEETKYREEAKRWMLACTGYPHWGNAHLVDVDLSAAWILFGMGLSYDWLKEHLSVSERRIIREKIQLQGRRMYDFKVSTEGSGWSTNYWQNHNWINMTGLAAAGYALIEEDESAEAWIRSAKENFAFVYGALPEDGSDYEGVVYWRYGAMWLFIYAHLLKEREGIDYFRSCPFLERTFYYRLYQAAPNLTEQMNFGDAHDRHSGHSTAVYYKVAAEYRNGHAQRMGNLVRDEFLETEARCSKVKPGILPECFFEMLFFDESVEEESFDSLPLTAYFDDLGLFVRRSSWERDATLFTFKCSSPGGKTQWQWLWKLKEEKGYDCFGLSHQHPDNNSFLIHSGGAYFAIDDGYNRTVRAADHNVVLVDGQGYEGEGQNNIWKSYTPSMKGTIEACVLRDGLIYIVGETAGVYRKDLRLESFKRHLIHTGRSWYVLLDELKSPLEHTYTWQMYSDIHPEVRGKRFSYTIGSAGLDLYQYADSPTAHRLTENVVRAVMTTQEPDKITENPMKGLCIANQEKRAEMSFLTVFVPRETHREAPVVEEIVIPGAYGAVITDPEREEQEIFLYAEQGTFSFMNREINGPLAVLRTRGEEIIDILPLQDGKG